ncbi:adenosylmethionine--8-amino-7-oxononanoate transaminase [Candidatus Vallotia tarda]|uniref:Adenosylmethionine-8-amino-7-oxononanoate aminotransferase n=1 Tax=Candidatus Vallotiella hemipterorum TaxID=1177213 RepID=A0A916NF17_9BURK|nr:adenosylmethionine--8-amino-7-oxononanoate transaminase [Candidatus Vallotia tarda]CAG7595852.1 Adenosylmethionine-8-amino-7-oxononanoate aminotransferase [Candidatus Vallotia tarda]
MSSSENSSSKLIARSLNAVWHPCTQIKDHEQLPLIAIARGAGAWLYDLDEKRYLDAISSWWVNLFGHANTHINAQLKAQLDTLEHAMLVGCTHEPAVELAERLSDLTGQVLGHAFFASDGASAVEIALKMSFHFWRNSGFSRKCEFVCVANGYHGETIGALGVTNVALFKDAYDPIIRTAHVVASPDMRQVRIGEQAADVVVRALDDVKRLFTKRSEQIAALIVEPLVQCATGFAMHDPSYLTGLRALCDEYHVHWIADEIAVGCGRTGTFFACEQAYVWPDFLCLSKGISGGYLPLSIVLTRDAIYAAFYDDEITRSFLHSHSYTGNPLACRAGLATLELFDTHDVLAHNRVMSNALSALLEPLRDHPSVQHLRRCGTLFAFDVSIPAELAHRFSCRFFECALENELLLRPIGTTVYLVPPYILKEDEQVLLTTRLRETLLTVLAELESTRRNIHN